MKQLNYISLFSGAGVGCYGFKEAGFECKATNELLKKRIKFQKFNGICSEDKSYIEGDITNQNIKDQIIKLAGNDLDVLIATPPCQGMSVANHKKNNEIKRNSLVTESINLIKTIQPNYFILENVRSFLKTICTDIEGDNLPIEDSINRHLASNYHIHSEVLNLSNFGSNSSRTRTIVLGTKKELNYVSPLDIYPEEKQALNLKELIGNLKPFEKMGDIDKTDLYHFFRNYDPVMRDWIKDLKEGQSAFENKNKNFVPHRIINGKKIINKSVNADKYRRNFWHKVGPCIHTRNDILASQNTVHPKDDRVFSIREIMRMMSVPENFKWSEYSFSKLNSLKHEEKVHFLKTNEMNIRQSLGEAVPTRVFKSIAEKISQVEKNKRLKKDILELIKKKKLFDKKNLINFIKKNDYSFETQRVIELANNSRLEDKAYYTSPSACFSLVNSLPDFKNNKVLKILEPSAGCGNFIPFLISKFKNCKKLIIDVIDIDKDSIDVIKALMNKINIPENVQINYFNEDFIHYKSNNFANYDLFNNSGNTYDIVIGNPPFGKLKKNLVESYSYNKFQKKSSNIYSYFLEKSMRIAKYVGFISPKSFISSPEFSVLRNIVSEKNVLRIDDHGEKAFDSDVKIETIGLVLSLGPKSNKVEIDSWITQKKWQARKNYIISSDLPYWIIYRNKDFDKTLNAIETDVFNVFRDRQITKKITNLHGKYRVIKSRNIGNNEILNIKNYDAYIDNIDSLVVKKFLNKKVVLVPNLSYYPRATFLPKNSIVDGSAAILIPKININKKDLDFFASDEFSDFYRVARNFGTRSLNIDANSVFFFGKVKTNAN